MGKMTLLKSKLKTGFKTRLETVVKSGLRPKLIRTFVKDQTLWGQLNFRLRLRPETCVLAKDSLAQRVDFYWPDRLDTVKHVITFLFISCAYLIFRVQIFLVMIFKYSLTKPDIEIGVVLKINKNNKHALRLAVEVVDLKPSPCSVFNQEMSVHNHLASSHRRRLVGAFAERSRPSGYGAAAVVVPPAAGPVCWSQQVAQHPSRQRVEGQSQAEDRKRYQQTNQDSRARLE